MSRHSDGADARPDLSRLPAARHRQQRLQRQPRPGARPARPRRPPALPGPRGGALDWVDAVGRWEAGLASSAAGSSPGRGSITAYLPDIGGLLPVYVDDDYEGFEVKTFPELTDAELDALPGRQRRRRPRRRAPARRGRRRARQPPRDGPGDPRPRRRSGYAAKVHGSRPLLHRYARTRPLPPLRAGGDGGRRGRSSSAPATPPRASGRRSRRPACRRRPGSARPGSTPRRSRRCRTAPTPGAA